MDYNTFVRYTVYLSMISLPRNELRDKIIKGSEILEVLHSNPDVKQYLFSLYNCHYADFFKHLGDLSLYSVFSFFFDYWSLNGNYNLNAPFLGTVEGMLRRDYLIHPHYRYYVREMRILAYTQLLESYRSLTLQYMADSFGVTVEYVDQYVNFCSNRKKKNFWFSYIQFEFQILYSLRILLSFVFLTFSKTFCEIEIYLWFLFDFLLLIFQHFFSGNFQDS